ncbi:MAG: hypothetical protein KAI64_06205 [Thermoplasmata archaeon]|nr:hypothetical protein [Thermoplasmata archaeon]
MPNQIDAECVALCDAINLYSPKIRTVESCCGHGERHYKIWLRIEPEGLAELPHILYFLDPCHTGFVGWSCKVYTDCGMSPVSLMIKGPDDKRSYDEALTIARLIREDYENTQPEETD